MDLDFYSWNQINSLLGSFQKREKKNFTLLMSTYKGDNLNDFQRAIISILKNSILPKEFIIVLDGPVSDQLISCLVLLKDKTNNWIKIIPLTKNHGLGFALSEGVRKASFDIIARADADDLNYENRFKLEFEFLERNRDIMILGGQIREFDLSGNNGRIRRVPEKNLDILKMAIFRNPFNHPTVMFRKKKVLEAGNYKNYKGFEDYDLWVRVLQLSNIKVANLNAILVYMNAGNNLYSRRGGKGYLKEYFYLKQRMLKNGYINIAQFVLSVFLMLVIVYSPVKIRKMIYNIFLRK